MSAFVTVGAGFLLAVLWFDLMFDVQILGLHEREGFRRSPPPEIFGESSAG